MVDVALAAPESASVGSEGVVDVADVVVDGVVEDVEIVADEEDEVVEVEIEEELVVIGALLRVVSGLKPARVKLWIPA